MRRVLELREYLCGVRLGCEADERRIAQNVHFSVQFEFGTWLRAETSDDLADTVCYAEVCQVISELARLREYKLIESLGADVFSALKQKFGRFGKINLVVHKLSPPVAGLGGGSLYHMREFEF